MFPAPTPGQHYLLLSWGFSCPGHSVKRAHPAPGLSHVCSGVPHIAAWSSTAFLFVKAYSIVQKCSVLFIRFPVGGRMSCPHVLAVVRGAARNGLGREYWPGGACSPAALPGQASWTVWPRILPLASPPGPVSHCVALALGVIYLTVQKHQSCSFWVLALCEVWLGLCTRLGTWGQAQAVTVPSPAEGGSDNVGSVLHLQLPSPAWVVTVTVWEDSRRLTWLVSDTVLLPCLPRGRKTVKALGQPGSGLLWSSVTLCPRCPLPYLLAWAEGRSLLIAVGRPGPCSRPSPSG